MSAKSSEVVQLICAVLIPPVGVFLKRPSFNEDLVINILLTLLGYIPGVLHALYVILRK